MTGQEDVAALLLSRFSLLTKLSQDDRNAIARLSFDIQSVPAHHHLVREGAPISRCCILLEGYACRHKLNAQGHRQIVSFHVRGDLLDLQHFPFETADHNIQTITKSDVAWVPSSQLQRLLIDRPAIAHALWQDALIEASIFREWVLNVGRRNALTRIAHMLCEFAVRAQALGLGTTDTFEFPMTQSDIADATGLTSVHVNRTLRRLRDSGAFEQDRHVARIRDWTQLKSIAGFDPGYLHGLGIAA